MYGFIRWTNIISKSQHEGCVKKINLLYKRVQEIGKKVGIDALQLHIIVRVSDVVAFRPSYFNHFKNEAD